MELGACPMHPVNQSWVLAGGDKSVGVVEEIDVTLGVGQVVVHAAYHRAQQEMVRDLVMRLVMGQLVAVVVRVQVSRALDMRQDLFPPLGLVLVILSLQEGRQVVSGWCWSYLAYKKEDKLYQVGAGHT